MTKLDAPCVKKKGRNQTSRSNKRKYVQQEEQNKKSEKESVP